MIKKLILENFKSLKKIEFDLCISSKKISNVAYIYGENGSGKTNIVDAFGFLMKTFRTFNVVNSVFPQVLQDLNEKEEDFDRFKSAFSNEYQN